MTTLILAPASACPTCHPGDQPGARPITAEDANGQVTATYQCLCGTAWRVRWARDGWPVDSYVQVTPEEAGVNRGVLELALAEQDRERHHAA